jgi:hypothetical protein
MNRQYGITPSPAHHSICTLFSCSSFPSKQRHLRCTGDFVEWIPLFQLVYGGSLPDLPILAHEASAHARVLRLRQVLP